MPPPLDLDGLRKLAVRLATEGPVRTLSTPRRIRILLDGHYIADTFEAKYVWEHPYYPQYYIPTESLTQSKDIEVAGVEDLKDFTGRVVAQRWEIRAPSRKIEKVVAFHKDNSTSELAGYVKIDWHDPDQWFEEDSPIFVHPKDPFKRVDLIPSTRGVRISVDGQKIAETVTAIHLYETGLPVRYYMPLTAVDQAVLRPSKTKTQCPYKGESEYYDVVIAGKEHKDIVWYYNTPTIECAGIAGLVCFYNEKVDVEIEESGEWKKLERPKTNFS